MLVQINGKRWKLCFRSNMTNRGDVDAPHKFAKEIRISSSLKGEEKLEVLIHEFLHANQWHLAEEFVDRSAKDLSRILWRLGYRETEK